MSPEALASSTSIARLAGEIRLDRAALAKRIADANEATRRLAAAPDDPGALALAAVALHGWYTGAETIFERVARELDGSVPEGERWHRDLLVQMAVEIPGARARIIDDEALADLVALLAFRRFFRHAYAATLDPIRLSRELDRLGRLAPRLDASLDSLAAHLRDAAAELASR